MLAFVILSEAKNLVGPSTYAFEILRLKPQNDVVGQRPNPPLSKGDKEAVRQRHSEASAEESLSSKYINS